MILFLLKHKWMLLITLICLVLTFYIYEFESIKRGSRSPVGEFAIPFLPILFQSIRSTASEFKEELGE